MAVVNVGKRSIGRAPYSASRCSPTSSAPPSIAGRSGGSTARRTAAERARPERAGDSSCTGSSPRRVATTGRATNGK